MKIKIAYIYLTFSILSIGSFISLRCSNYSEISEAIQKKYCSNS